jgi:hypothetical protein
MILSSCQNLKHEEQIGGQENPQKLGKLDLKFDNVVGAEDLVLNTKTYKNAAGEDFTISKLQYFVSNIKLITTDGKEVAYPQDQSYFLVREADPASHHILLENLPEGNYREISFVIGVDSLRNTMDISKRIGNLDIANAAKDMYWSWNSGYIFLKMEGNAPAAKSERNQDGRFMYHIGLYGGGFGTPPVKTVNNVKIKAFPLNDPLKIGENQFPSVEITMDAMSVFTGVKQLTIAAAPVIMVNPKSADVAKNYITGFSLKRVLPNVAQVK